MVNPSHAAPVNSTQTKINTFFQGQSASPRASPRPGALASRPVNSSPQKSCAESSGQTTRESTRRLPIVDNVGDDSDFSLSEEESEDEEVIPTASKGKKRKKPTSSKGKKPSNIRHRYRGVPDQYKEMTTARLNDEGHFATFSFLYNHLLFAKEAEAFNGVTINDKPVWQKQPSGPSTLHNSIIITDHFTSLAPFLDPLKKLCKPRPLTDRLFLKQRVQQYTKSGRRHRDGENGPYRICVTIHDPAAPPHFKQLEVGVADANKAKGGHAVNPFQLKADGKPDSQRIDCKTGSCHLMDRVGTGTDSHAHHQALIDKDLLPEHGAQTTFVIDLDPISPDTIIEDIARIAAGTADVVRTGVGVSARVPPPTPGQIGQSCGSTQTSDYHKQRKVDDPVGYKKEQGRRGRNGAAPGLDGVGKPFDSGIGAAARNFSREGADKRYYGLHLNVPMTGLAAELARLVQEDGSLLEEEGKPLPLCSTDVAPGYPGCTKGKGLFGLSREGKLVMGVHNSAPGRTTCVSGGTIPVTSKGPPYKVPDFAIAPLREGKFVSNKVYNETEKSSRSRARGRRWRVPELLRASRGPGNHVRTLS